MGSTFLIRTKGNHEAVLCRNPCLVCLQLNCGSPLGDSVSSADCDCDYHPGGCIISTPAPVGFKCVCVYKGFWTCGGYAEGCSHDDTCEENCYSKECCIEGGGDCGGYTK